MTQAAIDECKVALQDTRAELVFRTSGRSEMTVESAADSLDQTMGLHEREMALGGMDRDFRRLRSVRSGLARIEAGTFGICVNCESDIASKRLAAVPWTELCITCQERSDGAFQPQAVADSMTEAA